jgi:hypothetical protein
VKGERKLVELKFWRTKPDPVQERIATALEKLLLLYSLSLEAQGINSLPALPEDDGEIYYEHADPRDTHAKLVDAAELERAARLAEWTRELERTDFSTTVWSGPEGAEDAALPL